MDKAQAIHEFWAGFGWPAYDESTVPEKEPGAAQLPYITYMIMVDDFEHPVYMEASLWTRSTSWSEISQKADEVSESIGYGGKVIPFDDGFIWIQRGQPFAQRLSGEDDTIRRIMINIVVEYLTIH